MRSFRQSSRAGAKASTAGCSSVAKYLSLGEESEAASGYLDHLFLDQEGVPTLVEVKRSSDTRVRREVVGQMLDYAANAVAYWPSERLQNLFARRCEREGLDPDAELNAHLGAERDSTEFWEQAAVNLKAGRIRLVFVADEIPTSLQRIVEFLNEQMEDAEVMAIEVKQYVGAGLRTLVPRMIGQTAVAQTKRARGAQRQWDESTFFDELATKRGPEEARVAGELLEWARVQMPRFASGKGKVDGSFTPVLGHNGTPHYPLAVYTYGRIEIQFQWLTKPPFDDVNRRRELLQRLNQIRASRSPRMRSTGAPVFRSRCSHQIKTHLRPSKPSSTGFVQRSGGARRAVGSRLAAGSISC